MEQHPGMKRNTSAPFAETWLDLETVTQSEARKRETNIIYEQVYVDSRKMVQLKLSAKKK